MPKSYYKSYKQAHITWECMLSRCYQNKNKDYKNYGAKGITVCKEWHDFKNFVLDMGFPPDNPVTGERLTLDRIDGTKGYFKENCRWATRSQQNKNRKFCKNKLNKYLAMKLVVEVSPSSDFEFTLSGTLIKLGPPP